MCLTARIETCMEGKRINRVGLVLKECPPDWDRLERCQPSEETDAEMCMMYVTLKKKST